MRPTVRAGPFTAQTPTNGLIVPIERPLPDPSARGRLASAYLYGPKLSPTPPYVLRPPAPELWPEWK